MDSTADYWGYLDQLVAASKIVIDRPKGSAHPRYPEVIYPLDYGYLEGTRAMDGGGIDLWLGSGGVGPVQGVLCTADLGKRETEVKLLIGCSEGELQQILALTNQGLLRGLLVRRQPATPHKIRTGLAQS